MRQLTKRVLNSENVGLLGVTRVGSRRVIHVAACFMIFFSVLGTLLNYKALKLDVFCRYFIYSFL